MRSIPRGSGSVGVMPRYLHTCYRIGDIDRSVAFYEKLGFEEPPHADRRRGVNVFMALPDEDPVLELTYNHGVDSYDLGTGYNHIALAVDDLDGTLSALAGDGIEPEKPPYRPADAPRTDDLLRARSGRLPGRAHRPAVALDARGLAAAASVGRSPGRSRSREPRASQ